MTPMQRTRAVLKENNLKSWIVEYWNPWAKHRIDLFNIIDMIVLDSGIIGIQVCGSDLSSHKTKIMEEYKDNTFAWLNAGGLLKVWAWRKLKKKRGGNATYWKPRIITVSIVQGELYWEEAK